MESEIGKRKFERDLIIDLNLKQNSKPKRVLRILYEPRYQVFQFYFWNILIASLDYY